MDAALRAPDEMARRAEFHERIGQHDMTPLWEVPGALVPPQPRSPAQAARWS